MHLFDDTQKQPVTDVTQLIEHFEEGRKPASKWLVGTEHEMAGVLIGPGVCGQPPPYAGPHGIRAVYEAYVEKGWTPIFEESTLIALSKDGTQITFEPGGQFEHAILPLAEPGALKQEILENFRRLSVVSEKLGLAWLQTGFRPLGTIDDVSWMPKQRYEIMREYLPTRGSLALEMMKRTCTVQVNLDYADSQDALRKMRCVQSVTSLLTALYANSPIVDGRVTDYQTYRAKIWLDMDPDRCGLLPFLHREEDVFRAYAEWAMDVPMFFVHRGEYKRCGGMTFRQFMKEGFQGERATIADWGMHLSTLFPEVRLKQYIEVRACDAGSIETMVALPALVSALLYDEGACEAATKLTAGLSMEERQTLRHAVPKEGLAAKVKGKSLRDLTMELLTIADQSAFLSVANRAYLQPLWQIVKEGRTQADVQKEIWQKHSGDGNALLRALAYPGLDGGLERMERTACAQLAGVAR